MTLFWIIAMPLALAAGAAIAWPLWRAEGRVSAVATLLIVAGGAAAVYAWSSRWDWPEAQVAETPAAMVAKLARRLEKQPDDLEGWLMLGRSQVALGQYPLAVRAYQRADRLEGGKNAEAVLGIAEALVMQADGKMDGPAIRLIERALELAPDWGRAQFFGALAAERRGDAPLAIKRYESMLAGGPPPDVRGVIEGEIARLRGGAALAAAAGPQGGSAAPAGSPQVTVAVSVAPALAARVTPGATLFVFVRAPGRPGPPLAVKRLPSALPATVTLTPADSMVPGLAFADGDAVEVSAKISADGSATPKSGDAIGRISYTVGKDRTRPLVIDGLTP